MACSQDNASQWRDMSDLRLLFLWASSIKIQLSMLVYYIADLIIILLKINLLSSWYSWKIAEMALNNNQVLTHKWLLSSDFISGFKDCISFIVLQLDHLFIFYLLMDLDGDSLENEIAPNSLGIMLFIYRYIKSIHSGNIASCKLLKIHLAKD